MIGTGRSTEEDKSIALVHSEGDQLDFTTWARQQGRPLAYYRRLQEEHFSAHPPTPASPPSPLLQLVMQQTLFYDGEEHHRVSCLMRAALASLLGPGGSFRACIGTVVDQFLGDVLPRGHMDVVSDFATPLTDQVMAAALGLPTNDWDSLQRLAAGADAFADVTSGYRRADTDAIFTLKEALRKVLPDKRAHRGHTSLADIFIAENKGEEARL